MGVFTWLDRFVSRVPLVVAIAMPLAVFLVADLAIQLITIQVWGGTGSLLRWEWSAIIVLSSRSSRGIPLPSWPWPHR